jgi:hypothetical protein
VILLASESNNADGHGTCPGQIITILTLQMCQLVPNSLRSRQVRSWWLSSRAPNIEGRKLSSNRRTKQSFYVSADQVLKGNARQLYSVAKIDVDSSVLLFIFVRPEVRPLPQGHQGAQCQPKYDVKHFCVSIREQIPPVRTPSGIGAARSPQMWLENRDVVEIEIEKIGFIRNRFVILQDQSLPSI